MNINKASLKMNSLMPLYKRLKKSSVEKTTVSSINSIFFALIELIACYLNKMLYMIRIDVMVYSNSVTFE